MSAGNIQLIQTLSAILIVLATFWRVGHLFMLRQRQREAIRDLCDQISALTCFHNFAETTKRLNRLYVMQEFFTRTVLGDKAPLGLIDEVIEVNALIASVRDAWAAHQRKSEANQATDPFELFRNQAQDLRRRARLVLYSL